MEGLIISKTKVLSQLIERTQHKRSLCITGTASKEEGNIRQHRCHDYKLKSLSSTRTVCNLGKIQRASLKSHQCLMAAWSERRRRLRQLKLAPLCLAGGTRTQPPLQLSPTAMCQTGSEGRFLHSYPAKHSTYPCDPADCHLELITP